MKEKVYIETSVVSYLCSRQSRDLIVAAIHRIRKAHAKRFNYDRDAIFADIRKRQEKRKNLVDIVFQENNEIIYLKNYTNGEWKTGLRFNMNVNELSGRKYFYAFV